MAQQWFVTRGAQQQGPLTPSQLKALVATGQLRPDDLIRRDDMPAPRAASTIKGLFPTSTVSPAAVVAPVEPLVVQPKKRLMKAALLIAGVAALLVLVIVVTKNSEFDREDKLRKETKEAAERGTKSLERTSMELVEKVKASDSSPASDTKPAIGTPTPNKDRSDAERTAAKPPVTKASDPPLAEIEGTLTARYLPCVPGNVKRYEEEIYDDKGQSLLFTQSRETCGDGGIIKVELTMKSPGVDPIQSTREERIRIYDGFVEVGTVSGNEVSWRRFIKIGAKPEENGWPDGQKTGSYHFVRFEAGKKGPHERAILEHRNLAFTNEGVVETLREIVLERDGGILSEMAWLIRDGKKRLMSQKKLISAANGAGPSRPSTESSAALKDGDRAAGDWKGGTIAEFIVRMRDFSRQDWPNIRWLEFDPEIGKAQSFYRKEAEFIKRFGQPSQNVWDRKKAEAIRVPYNDRFRLWTYQCKDGTVMLHVAPTHIQSTPGNWEEVLQIKIEPADCVRR